jgi:protein-disulfide isomerase
MRSTNRAITALLLGATILALAACGGSTPAARESSVVLPSASAASTSVATQPRATSEATTASPAAASTTITATATELARADRPYATLPQSRTPEGYYVLGQPDAPITLTHYSDFL